MIEMTRKEYDKLEMELRETKNRLELLESDFANASVVGWEKTEDEIDISGKITLVANFISWEQAKETRNMEEPLFISIENGACALFLSEMKELKNYLEEKIEYLEAK